MLNVVIRFALRYRMVVVVLSLAVLGYGTYLSAHLPIDVFPDLDRPRVVILAECPGLAPEEVETLVTQPIARAAPRYVSGVVAPAEGACALARAPVPRLLCPASWSSVRIARSVSA